VDESFLIVTNSADGTSDCLVRLLAQENRMFLRWNIDLWQHYEITVTNHTHSVSDPTGRTIDLADRNTILLWRKPFVDQMNFDGLPIDLDDQAFAREQMRWWLYALASKFTNEGRTRLVEPYADLRLPKLYQLDVAGKYFETPRYQFSICGKPLGLGPSTIAKPLGNPSVGSDRIFYTRLISAEELFRPYPWFVQGAIVGGIDMTCLYIHGACHFFECEFIRDHTAVDWRTEINTPEQSPWRLSTCNDIPIWSELVRSYMKRVGLLFGRLDFIYQGGVLYFLEVNSNGQFGWLEDWPKLSLHAEFLKALLDPSTEIRRSIL